MIDRDHVEEAPAEPRSGNVNEPVPYGTDVSGDWPSSRAPLGARVLPLVVRGGAAVMGGGAAVAVATRMARRT